MSIQKPILPGYVYVPKGDIYTTRHCRSRTLASGYPLYVVHAHGKPNRTLGLRVPASIAKTVFADAARSKKDRAQAVETKDLRDLNAARRSLAELYPKLPARLADAILRHGFAKKSGRVGRAASMDLDKRITLAVYAYARHRHTRYEVLLKTMDKDSARCEVRKELDAIIQRWSSSSNTRRGNPGSKLLPKKIAGGTGKKN